MNHILYYDDKANRIQCRPERRPVIEAIVNYWKNVNINDLFNVDCRTFFKNGSYLLLKDFLQDFQEVYYFNVSANAEKQETIPMSFMGDLLTQLLEKPEVLDFFLNDHVDGWILSTIASDDFEAGHSISVRDVLNLLVEPLDDELVLHFSDFVIPELSIKGSDVDSLPVPISNVKDMADYLLLLLSLSLTKVLGAFETPHEVQQIYEERELPF